MALALNLDESTRLRRSVLRLLEKAIDGEKSAEIFAATAQLAKQEKESFENILTLFYSLLTDLLELSQSPKNSLSRNPDLHRELESLSKKVNLEWVSHATQRLDLSGKPSEAQCQPPIGAGRALGFVEHSAERDVAN